MPLPRGGGPSVCAGRTAGLGRASDKGRAGRGEVLMAPPARCERWVRCSVERRLGRPSLRAHGAAPWRLPPPGA